MGTTGNVAVSIINDVTVEESIETFTVELSPLSGTPVVVTGINLGTVSIEEDLTDSMWFVS